VPEAEFRNGRLNGRCVVTCVDGARFDGQCVNDERNGFGKQVSARGNRDAGEYRNDDMNGSGVFIRTDGARSGAWYFAGTSIGAERAGWR